MDFQSGYICNVMRIPVAPNLCQYLVLSAVKEIFSPSNRYVVLAHCFKVHLSNY